MFKGQAIISKLTTMSDRGVRIQMDTQEIGKEEMTELFALSNEFVNFALSRSEVLIDDKDVPDIKPDFKGEKTPAQRMRACLYRLWEQKSLDQDFEVFYRASMDRFIDQLKDKLD